MPAPPQEDSQRPGDRRTPPGAPGDQLPSDDAPRPVALTERELEILTLASRGLSGPMIGAELTISALTVKAHFENIRAKLGVNDRTAAVAYALRNGLIV
jgi:DNA-binding NarL/FixJ family response regulator